ncbi:MAG: lactate racemase domain-containing protein [Chloroflexi bacterium]|nr:lactate racemase domain-containing protein [Chloroflexota bacterium]
MFPSAERAFQGKLLLPAFQRMRQEFPRPRVIDVPDAVAQAIQGLNLGKSLQAKRIAIGVGSRGLSDLVVLVAATVSCLRAMGAEPFIVPAMGSHGGATAEGQRNVLKNLGVTEETVGASICASMEVVEVGRLANGMPVFVDRLSSESDGVVLINRVKPHTDFIGVLESGLGKMAVLGLGKERGAATIHSYGVQGLRDLMPQAARWVVEKTPILFGLASIENAYHEIASLTAVPPQDIAGPLEKELLQKAYALMPRFPCPDLDVLIVDEIGKNISGVGMDTNVIGRVKVHGVPDNGTCDIRAIAVLDLSDETHGNASGIGLADVTTQRLVDQIDFEALYINCVTAGICGIQRSFIPMVAPNDREAIFTALRVCGQPDPLRARIAHIRNTLCMDEIEISSCLAEQVAMNPDITLIGQPFSLLFDTQGQLERFKYG